MEFLAFLLPLALLFDVAWVVRYVRDRRLVLHVRARHPAVFESLRGRPRRWSDPSEEVWVQQASVRRALRQRLAPLLPTDPELVDALAHVDAGERFLRWAVWIGAALSLLILLLFVLHVRRADERTPSAMREPRTSPAIAATGGV